jgi:PAS domain S-box-containing protein
VSKGRDKERVLIVDNNRSFVNLLSLFLTREGYQVTKAYDGVEALEAVRSSPPDFIILDLVMPKIDGGRVCHYLKLDPSYRNIPVVILSGVAAEVSSKMFEIGADAYIAKGNFEELKKDIAGTLELFQGKSWMASIRKSIIGVEKMQPREVVNELLLANNRRGMILENIAEGVLEVDSEGKIIYANPAASRILNAPEQDLILSSISVALEEHVRPEVDLIVKKFKISSTPMNESLTTPYRDKTLRINFSNIMEDLKFAGFCAIIQDITALTERIQELSLLSEIGIVLTSTLNLKTVLDLVMTKVKEVLNVEAGSLLLCHKEEKELTFEIALGEKWQALRGKRMKVDEGHIGWVVQRGQPLFIQDPSADERFDGSWDKETGFVTRSTLCTPIITRGEVIGVLQVSNKVEEGSFTESDTNLLSSIARYAAIAIENAKLYDEQKSMNEDLKAMQQSLLEGQRLKAMADLAGATVRELRQPLKSAQAQSEEILTSLPQDHTAQPHLTELRKDISKLGEIVRHIERITKMGELVKKEGHREKKKP